VQIVRIQARPARDRHPIRPHPRQLRALVLCSTLVCARDVAAQQLGNKVLGSTGVTAGVESPPGLFVITRFLQYSAGEVRNRNGDVVPIAGLDIDAFAAALGVAYTMKPEHAPYLTFAAGVPYANISVSSDDPAASLSGVGFSDMFLQPLKVGWRTPRFDVVSGWMVYIPTGRFEPRGGGPGKGYWTNQLSLGGAAYFDTARTRLVSALASYEINGRKRGIDIRRGNMFQIQGGAGAGIAKQVMAGIAGFALWQVSADRGTDIPPSLRDGRTRVFGLGPEIGVTIPKWRLHADARIEREFGVTSRSRGRVIAVGVSYAATQKR
jgi:hypothetical protein